MGLGHHTLPESRINQRGGPHGPLTLEYRNRGFKKSATAGTPTTSTNIQTTPFGLLAVDEGGNTTSFTAFYHRNLKPAVRTVYDTLQIARMMVSDAYEGHLPRPRAH